MMIPRRNFLGLAGATGLLAATGTPLSAIAPAEHPLTPGEINPVPVTAAWDMTWVDRITGTHRAVFDSPGIADGAAFFRANMWINQYKEVYGKERAEMSPVVIVRHTGILLAMKQEFWDRYEATKEFKLKNEDGKDVKKNPATRALPRFVESGGIVLGCALAFSGMVGTIQKQDKLTREQADAAGRALLLPGVILMPSGIFAAMRAQEAGCNYILAS